MTRGDRHAVQSSLLSLRTLVQGAALLSVLAAAGCYERVVAARGFGADQYNVAEPYQENSKVDDWIFGERSQTRNNTKLKGLSPK